MTLTDALSALLLLVFVATWLVAVGSAIELVAKHRPEGRSVLDYTQGSAWFGPDAFLPSGASAKRRMVIALVIFFGQALVVTAGVLAFGGVG